MHVRDGQVAAHDDDLVARICSMCTPDTTIVAPWVHDVHSDHQAVGRAAAETADLVTLVLLFWARHHREPTDFEGAQLLRVCLHESMRAKKRGQSSVTRPSSHRRRLDPCSTPATSARRNGPPSSSSSQETARAVRDCDDPPASPGPFSVDRAAWGSPALADTATAPVTFDDHSTGADDVLGEPGCYLDRAGFWPGACAPAACWAGAAIGIVVWSEVSYYLDPSNLRHTLRELDERLTPDGDLVVVNYTDSTNYPLTADQVESHVSATGRLQRRVSLRDESLRLDVWSRQA